MGLELDKIDIAEGTRRSTSAAGGRSPHSDGSAVSRKRSIPKLVLLATGVGLPIALLLLMWNQGFIELPLLQSQKILRQLAKIATVGPVMTSTELNEHFKITVQIECRTSKLKERLVEIGPVVKNRILMVLNSPEAIELLHRQEYAHLKDRFKIEIQSLLPKNSIKEVYFSEVVRY